MPIPVFAYDDFASLEQYGDINVQELKLWNLVIGLRNWIVHDYMNIDMQLVEQFITNNRCRFIAIFLCKAMPSTHNSDERTR